MTGPVQLTAEQNIPTNRRRTVLVLGASNVSLAWPKIVSLASQMTDGPVDLVTAHGMGRAYVSAASGFAMWRLPGILRSGLWDALGEIDGDESPSVLLTDLGNDLLYGRSPAEVLQGATDCIQRIRKWKQKADVVLVAPPLESVMRLGAVRFRIFKQVLFPFSRLSLSDIKAATEQLSHGIHEVSKSCAVKLYVPPADSYGFDPIHVRRRLRGDVFRKMSLQWDEPPCSAVDSQFVRRVVPQDRRVFGRERRQEQPVVYSERLRVFAF